MDKTAENKEKKVLLRLPERLWNRVWMQSRKNNRSINGEIITVLDDNTPKDDLTECEIPCGKNICSEGCIQKKQNIGI